MADWFSSGSSSSFSFSQPKLKVAAPEVKRRRKQGRGGVFGFFGNLVSDVKDTVTGIPGGIKEFWNDPVGSFKAIGESYSAMYGPLFAGDFERFGRNLYEHPLGPILDAVALATVPFTAGGSLALRGGSLTARTGSAVGSRTLMRVGAATRDFGLKVRRSDPLMIPAPGHSGMELLTNELGKPLNYAVKSSSTRPTQRLLQKATNRLMVELPDSTPLVGNTKRFGKWQQRQARYEAMSAAGQHRRWTRMFNKLSDPEQAAVTLLARGVHPSVYKKYLDTNAEKLGDMVSPGMRKALDNPDVKKFYERPSKRMLEAVEEGRRLADLDAEIKVRHGWLSPEEALEAPFQWMRIIEGAKFLDGRAIERLARKTEKKLARLDKDEAKTMRRAARIQETGTPALRAHMKEADRLANESSGAARRRERLRQEAESLGDTRRELEAVKADMDALMVAGEAADDAILRSGVRILKDEEKTRLRALGKAYDRVLNLQAKYERQAAAYIGLQRRLEHAAFIVERQSQNFDNILAARAERADLLRIQREALDQIQATRHELFAERKRIAQMQPGIHGGRSRAEILADIEEGRAIEPFYMPDAATTRRVNVVAHQGGGKGPVRNPVFVNKGVRQKFGRIALNANTLTEEYLNTVKSALHTDIHETLIGAASRLEIGAPLPEGWVFVRRRSSEKIGAMERDIRQHEQSLESLAIEPDGVESLVSATEGMTQGRYRLIVPRKLVNQLAGEYRRSHRFIQLAFDKPTTIWRKLVLGLRPAFFVNNFVGNHFLYALSYAGMDGLRAYVNAVKTSRGSGAALRMIRDGATPDEMREALMLEFFPDQIHGTFGETQFPSTIGRRKRKVERVTLGVMPATQAVAEGMLRRAAVETTLRKSGEFRKVADSLPRQQRKFENVARQALDENPDLARRVSREVNDALGDYFNMSATERHYIRQLFPFYAWYRAIFTVTMRLPSKAPLKSALMVRVSEIGLEETRDMLGQVPSFLRGAVPIPDSLLEAMGLKPENGRIGILATTGINPMYTVAEEIEALQAFSSGEDGAVGRDIFTQANPFVQALIESATGRDLLSGAPTGAEGALPVNLIKNVVEGLPPTRIAMAAKQGKGDPKKPTLYSNSVRRQLLNFVGVPVRQMSPKRAKEMALDEFFEPIKRKKTKKTKRKQIAPLTGF